MEDLTLLGVLLGAALAGLLAVLGYQRTRTVQTHTGPEIGHREAAAADRGRAEVVRELAADDRAEVRREVLEASSSSDAADMWDRSRGRR